LLANQIDDLFDDFFVTDINHHPLITIENQIDITAQHMPQLVIDFDNMGKTGLRSSMSIKQGWMIDVAESLRIDFKADSRP